jgi:hypothetical protein
MSGASSIIERNASKSSSRDLYFKRTRLPRQDMEELCLSITQIAEISRSTGENKGQGGLKAYSRCYYCYPEEEAQIKELGEIQLDDNIMQFLQLNPGDRVKIQNTQTQYNYAHKVVFEKIIDKEASVQSPIHDRDILGRIDGFPLWKGAIIGFEDWRFRVIDIEPKTDNSALIATLHNDAFVESEGKKVFSTHISTCEENYIEITSGSNDGIANCDPSFCTTSNSNIFSLLQNHGYTWKAYEESMPSNCYPNKYDTAPNEYLDRHNPPVFYTDIATQCKTDEVPLGNITTKTGALITDLSSNKLPTFSFVTPNDCHDMENCGTGQNPMAVGDHWLSVLIPEIMNSQYGSSTVIFITFDSACHN